MHLAAERIEVFKQLYAKRFGKQIDNVEDKARQLLRLMELIYTPMRRTELEAVRVRTSQLGITRRPAPQLHDSKS